MQHISRMGIAALALALPMAGKAELVKQEYTAVIDQFIYGERDVYMPIDGKFAGLVELKLGDTIHGVIAYENNVNFPLRPLPAGTNESPDIHDYVSVSAGEIVLASEGGNCKPMLCTGHQGSSTDDGRFQPPPEESFGLYWHPDNSPLYTASAGFTFKSKDAWLTMPQYIDFDQVASASFYMQSIGGAIALAKITSLSLPTAVPEPNTGWLMAIGGVLMLTRYKRAKRRN